MRRTLRADERDLLRQIKAKNKELQDFEDEIEAWLTEDNPFNVNDCKAEAAGAARELIELLKKAHEMGMNTELFPIVQELTQFYITKPRERLVMAGGGGCH